MQTHPPARLHPSTLWFTVFIGAVCVWVLSLPIFPTQDGPMHRYYAHALGQVLGHNPEYAVYTVRHPFPPYATQYISLLALFHFFSFDWAEKVFTCLDILCFAWGLRLAATAVGPAGAWVSLLIAPLLLPWYLMMGFYNYSIGLGIALFAVAFWLRLDRSRWALPGFALSALVLIFSHPVPVALLLAFLLLDLLRRRFLASRPTNGWLRGNGRQLTALAYALCLSLYPALAIDTSESQATLHNIRFHYDWTRTTLLLAGLSPYNTRSHGFLVNGYRLALYALLVGSFAAGIQVLRRSMAVRRLCTAAGFLVYAALFALVLPFLPERVSGGGFFATRMVILVWVLAVLAAAGQPLSRRLPNICILGGLLFTILSLAPAERTMRPFAESVHRVESETVPAHVDALLLDGPMLNPMLRNQYDVTFDPFVWANMLPLIQHDDLALNAPWLQLSSFPLRVAPGAMIAKDPSAIIELKAQDPPPRLDVLLPHDPIDAIVENSTIVTYTATPHEIESGLRDFLGHHDAAAFSCKRSEFWSLLCVRKGPDAAISALPQNSPGSP